ncbi:MAG: hypothetical protein ACFFD4_07100 [Candidatus Odinarchaeota archaeon]
MGSTTVLEVFEDKNVEFTCNVCKKKVTFIISAGDLQKATSGPGLIKKAINHNNDHIIVVHVDLNCNVRRMYEYDCADTDTTNMAKITEGTQDIPIINLNDLKKDPRGAMETIFGHMEKISKRS